MKKIIAAWIEQILEFETDFDYQAYIAGLQRKPGRFQVVEHNQDETGKVTLRIRKQYNNNNFPED